MIRSISKADLCPHTLIQSLIQYSLGQAHWSKNRISIFFFLFTALSFSAGIIAVLKYFLAYKYSYYLHQLHENELWFSEISVGYVICFVIRHN